MQECSTGTAFTPQWYVVLDLSRTIIAGAGLIANDFHKRRELTPNVCAPHVENAWRGNGYARTLPDHIRREAGSEGFPRFYFIIDHTVFYEVYGWEYLSLIREDSGDPIRMYTAKTLQTRKQAVFVGLRKLQIEPWKHFLSLRNQKIEEEKKVKRSPVYGRSQSFYGLRYGRILFLQLQQ